MKKKALLIAVAAIVLAVITAASVTVAWLTAESNQVTNTFTYGNITIKLEETSTYDEVTTTAEGMNFTHIVPGDVISKEPVVTVLNGSEPCFVYVLITNKLDGYATYNIDENKWIEVEKEGSSVLYRYGDGNTAIDARTGDKPFSVFTTVEFAESLTVNDVTNVLPGKDVVIKAFAHQYDNTDVNTADEAAIEWAGLN